MPKKKNLRKVMVIGSGPIVIGQAAEFDYAGTQACKALREEGIEVVLVNSNPATIMTDTEMADYIYLEPLEEEFLSRIVARERPDGILPALGGQTGLNMAMELSERGVLDKYNVKLLGTPLEAIRKAEDRDLFKKTMMTLKEPVPESCIVFSIEEAVEFASNIGFPLIVRPAFTLGGTGGGMVDSEEDLITTVSRGLKQSRIRQVLLEQSVAGWKEIEFEVMRDCNDNCITVCSMENFDPIGVHTGDSIVFAPAQTLSNREYNLLRDAALKIIKALQIEGGCNIQFALDPQSCQYYVIEVNPRVSRSSALASKATGYPIAKVATKIAIGYTLDEIVNTVTGETTAFFEPNIDYVVTKIPRWPFDKFITVDRRLGTQMKATGEVMAIGRTLEESLMKAVRSLEIGINGLVIPELAQRSDTELKKELKEPNDKRLFLIAEGIRRSFPLDELYRYTSIDPFFLSKISNIVDMYRKLSNLSFHELSPEILRRAKAMGFCDAELAEILSVEEKVLREYREKWSIWPVYKMVDTCAGEFEAETPYFYSTYETENEALRNSKRKVVVLGSGPIRIGQGIEFDYCSVHSVLALQEEGIEAVIINNNPETVSTDFDCADKLYFEPLTVEDILNVIREEEPQGVIVQFGGQTAINLAKPLSHLGITVLGTSIESIDYAEDREKCNYLLRSLGIPQPEGCTVTSTETAMGVALKMGFPVLVRPSYVIGGRAMEIIYNEEQLFSYLKLAARVSPEHPILVDRYLLGKEIEVDAVSDGESVLIPGIMEHVERAGIHSGDSIAFFPPHNLEKNIQTTLVDYTNEIARALQIKGLFNIQFILYDNRLYVLEINPRASRTVPILSKVTGVPMVKLATQIMLGRTLRELGYGGGLLPPPPYLTVKAPVFSFEKLYRVDIALGPEMKSTGEVLGIDCYQLSALYKAMLASGILFSSKGAILTSIADQDKKELVPLLKRIAEGGFKIYATAGTARALEENGGRVEYINKVGEGLPNVVDLIREGKVDWVINTPTFGRTLTSTGYQVRRACVELKVPCFTSPDTARAFLQVLGKRLNNPLDINIRTLKEYLQDYQESLKRG